MKTIVMVLGAIALAANLAVLEPRMIPRRAEGALRIEKSCQALAHNEADYAFCVRYKAYESGLYRPLSAVSVCDARLDMCASKPGATYEACRQSCREACGL